MAMLAAFETHSHSDMEESRVIDGMLLQLQTFQGILESISLNQDKKDGGK